MERQRQPLGRRVHAWLSEPEGETFRDGKWRFWFIAVAGLQLLNAGLTALIFKSSGHLQNYMGAILLGVGALVGWIAVGCLHYSDSPNRQLSRGVSALDSATLIFVVAHFCFLTWAYGHLATLRSAEDDYKAQAVAYNENAEKAIQANVEIAKSAEHIADRNALAEKLRNDTAYQERKTAEALGVRSGRRSAAAAGGIGAGLRTQTIELEKPDKPKGSSTAFLMKWDSWIRAANFGELLLACVTLIFIRNHTAKTNAPGPGVYIEPDYHSTTQAYGPRHRPGFVQAKDQPLRPKAPRNWI